jgi:hypothetical protein
MPSFKGTSQYIKHGNKKKDIPGAQTTPLGGREPVVAVVGGDEAKSDDGDRGDDDGDSGDDGDTY